MTGPHELAPLTERRVRRTPRGLQALSKTNRQHRTWTPQRTASKNTDAHSPTPDAHTTEGANEDA